MNNQPSHGDIMAKLEEIDRRLERGDRAFSNMGKRMSGFEKGMKPLSDIVARMGGAEEFTEQAKEAADGLRAIRTFAKWIKALGALAVAIAAIAAGVKYMVYDMWRGI